MQIESLRLCLRKITSADLSDWHKVLGDSENMQYYPTSYTKERVQLWMERNEKNYQNFGFGLWALCLKDTGEFIGDCGLSIQNINGLFRPEIGYHLLRSEQGKGYAKEAACAVRDWAFQNTPFGCIYSYMTAKNIPSRHTAMAYGARLLEEYVDDRYGKIVVYGISRGEWEGLKRQ